MNEITYTKNGDYLVPDIAIQEQTKPLGKYGRMRRKYLQEHRPILFSSLSQSGALFPHLLEIEEAANRRLERMVPEMAQAAGITEQIKTTAPLRWVGEMNNIKACAEEIVLQELIYN